MDARKGFVRGANRVHSVAAESPSWGISRPELRYHVRSDAKPLYPSVLTERSEMQNRGLLRVSMGSDAQYCFQSLITADDTHHRSKKSPDELRVSIWNLETLQRTTTRTTQGCVCWVLRNIAGPGTSGEVCALLP